MTNTNSTVIADRPAIAIINNSFTPYRLHINLRVVHELPEIKLFSLFTHSLSNAAWAFNPPEETNSVMFGEGDSADSQAMLFNAWREWRKGGRIIRFLKDQNVRFVILMGYNDAGRLRIIRWCRRAGIPLFVWGDANVLLDRAGWPKRWIKKLLVTRIVRACAGVMVCGRLGRDFFLRYGADPTRVYYFPLEPDYNMIRRIAAEQIASAQQRFGLSAERRRIVFSGRLIGLKRVDLLLRAFISIAAERPEWDVLIIGDGPLKAPLLALIPEALRSRVQWTGFLDDQTTISALYRSCDVLVLPSDFDQWALVINEAAAAGLAIIASSVVGAAAELVEDGVNGRVFRRGDLDSLTEALREVTAAANIDRMKAAAEGVLARWRQTADPIDGLRKTLRAWNLIEADAG